MTSSKGSQEAVFACLSVVFSGLFDRARERVENAEGLAPLGGLSS